MQLRKKWAYGLYKQFRQVFINNSKIETVEKTESKFKWLEAVDSVMLLEAINPMTLEDKTELVSDILHSDNLNEAGLNNAVVVYSQITLELAKRMAAMKEEIDGLKRAVLRYLLARGEN